MLGAFFRDVQGFGRMDAGSRAGWFHQFNVSTTMDLNISIFVIASWCMAVRNLDLFIKTDWSVICLLFAENAGRE